MRKTVVISAKVTPDIAAAIKAQALAADQSVSAWLNDAATRMTGQEVSRASRGIVVPTEVDTKIVDIAATVGGSAFVGILAFKLIKGGLTNKKAKGEISYDETEIEALSALLGVTAAIITGIGIHKVLSKQIG